jgi:hypothetical protein
LGRSRIALARVRETGAAPSPVVCRLPSVACPPGSIARIGLSWAESLKIRITP